MITTQEHLSKSERPGVIEPAALYALHEIQARSGFSKTAMRTARRAGLQFRYVGGRAFCYGEDFINFVRVNGKTSKTAKASAA